MARCRLTLMDMILCFVLFALALFEICVDGLIQKVYSGPECFVCLFSCVLFSLFV